MWRTYCLALAFLAAFVPSAARAQTPLGPAFTYQGGLQQNGTPLNGPTNLAFSLWDAAGTGTPPTGGNQIGSTQTVPAVQVTQGRFTVPLNDASQFGASAFNGQARWLQITVNGTTLAPRQPLTATPFALYALASPSGGGPWSVIDSNVFYNGGNVGIGTAAPTSTLDVRGLLTLEAGGNAGVVTGIGPLEMNRYLGIFNSLQHPSASGLKAGGILVSDSFAYANPGKSDLIVKGNVGVGTASPDARLHVVTSDDTQHGIHAEASGSGIAIFGQQSHADSYAGSFFGRVFVNGIFEAGIKHFRIDHPLDPARKYLQHACVESPDMMNIYNGNVTTDDRGYATVTLPDWFEALNRDFRYQLTVIDDTDGEEFVQVKVTRRIAERKFTLRSSRPLTQVSWQVTGIRKDAYAEAHRVAVEQNKPPAERGRYLHPEVFGKSAAFVVNAGKPPARGTGDR